MIIKLKINLSLAHNLFIIYLSRHKRYFVFVKIYMQIKQISYAQNSLRHYKIMNKSESNLQF